MAPPPLTAAADLQGLWCAYGLAGCTEPAATTAAVAVAQPAGVHVQSTAPATRPLSSTLEVAPAEAEDYEATHSTAAEASTAAAGHPAVAAEAAAGAPSTEHLLMLAGDGGTTLHSATLDAAAAAASEAAAVEASTTAAAAGAVAVAAKAAAAAAATPGASGTLQAMPAWALALLGASVACAAVVQLWHVLPHSGMLRRLAPEEAAPAVQNGPGSPQPLRASVPSVDVEGALAAPADGQDQKLAPAPPPAAQVTPAAIEDAEDNQQAWAVPGPLQSGKASPRPASPCGPAPLDVEPSVAARDLSRVAWVPSDPQQAHRRLSEFHNPLFGSAGSPAGGTPAAAGAAAADPRGSWRAKTATLGAQAEGEAGGDDFRLLAAALPEPSGSGVWDSTGQQAAASAGAASSSSGSAADPPPPGSPGKAAAKPWASRKLTAAKSVGPQELPSLVDGVDAEPAVPSLASYHAAPASSDALAPQQASTAGGSLQPEQSAAWSTLSVHAAAGGAPLHPVGSAAATTCSFRLLTAQQFHVSAPRGGWVVP